MTESLDQLVRRRQRELGVHGEPISTRQVWLRGGGDGVWSYETVRRIVEVGHHRIGDKVADRLAIALDVPVSTILAAAGQRPRLGRFQLPSRADRLTERERAAVMAVVDAILDAGGAPLLTPAGRAPAVAPADELDVGTVTTAGSAPPLPQDAETPRAEDRTHARKRGDSERP